MCNGPPCHYILLKQVEEGWENTFSLKLLGKKVSFRQEDFDIKMGLRYKPRRKVLVEKDKTLRLRRLYLRDRTSMIRSKFEKDYPTLHFKNDKDTVKILVFYFIKLVMIGQKKR